jgi:dihydrofolate reductase
LAELVVIAAVAEGNRVIGRDMDLPWHIPADLRRFKRLTTGHPLVMGRRTFESLVNQFGGPLPQRENAVLTRDPAMARRLPEMGPNVRIYPTLEAALAAYSSRERIFIGGGASVYEAVLRETAGAPIADRLELTIVEGSFEGDTTFPPYEHLLNVHYELSEIERHDPQNSTPGFRFESWIRKGSLPGVPPRA